MALKKFVNDAAENAFLLLINRHDYLQKYLLEDPTLKKEVDEITKNADSHLLAFSSEYGINYEELSAEEKKQAKSTFIKLIAEKLDHLVNELKKTCDKYIQEYTKNLDNLAKELNSKQSKNLNPKVVVAELKFLKTAILAKIDLENKKLSENNLRPKKLYCDIMMDKLLIKEINTDVESCLVYEFEEQLKALIKHDLPKELGSNDPRIVWSIKDINECINAITKKWKKEHFFSNLPQVKFALENIKKNQPEFITHIKAQYTKKNFIIEVDGSDMLSTNNSTSSQEFKSPNKPKNDSYISLPKE